MRAPAISLSAVDDEEVNSLEIIELAPTIEVGQKASAPGKQK